jgi:hypothetical protein
VGTNPIALEGTDDSESRSGPPEGLEEKTNGLLHLLIWIEHDLTFLVVNQPHRKRHSEFATARLVQKPTPKPCPHDVQLGLTHRAFQSQQETIVEVD